MVFVSVLAPVDKVCLFEVSAESDGDAFFDGDMWLIEPELSAVGAGASKASRLIMRVSGG